MHFTVYSRSRLRRDFHQLRLLGSPPVAVDGPLVVYANHSSWWDPLVALAIRPLFFPDRQAYAPMDAEMLQRYGIFKFLGFFGVDRSSVRGVLEFLHQAKTVLRRQGTLLYLTPQGRFADVRDHPPGFQRGIGSLAARLPGTAFLPLAVEYVFWEESKPEILLHFGEIQVFRGQASRDQANEELEQALAAAQVRLATASRARRADRFQTLLLGRHGVGGPYDLWRRIRSWTAGQPAPLKHGKL